MKYLMYRRRGPVKHRPMNNDVTTLQDLEEDEQEDEADVSDHPVKQLQEAHGNRAVSELLGDGTAVPIAAADSMAEREADEIAAQVADSQSEAVTEADADNDPEQTEFVGSAPESVETVVESDGQPLDDDLRTELEAAYGEDFEDVRVHTGQQAAESTDEVGARAYTVGQHIVFDQDEYAPETANGGERGRADRGDRTRNDGTDYST